MNTIKKWLLLCITTVIVSFSYAQKAGESYFIQSAIAGKNLDVQWGASDDGTPLHLWPANGGAAQQFTLEDAGDGYFYIQSALGKYIHVQNRSAAPKALALIWEGKGNDNTKWRFEDAGDGYQYIQSKKGTYLDVQWASDKDGTPIWQWSFNGGDAQRWRLLKLDSQSASGPDITKEAFRDDDLEFYTETINLESITNLCPSTLVGGDLEFASNGPQVFGSVDLWRSKDSKEINAYVHFNARETHSDFLTGRSEVKGYWKIPVYRAPHGTLINGLVSSDTQTEFDKVLQGGGANELFGGGDGSPHLLTQGNGLGRGGFVEVIEVVGDTGGWDISTDDNCKNDTRILRIDFRPVHIEFAKKRR